MLVGSGKSHLLVACITLLSELLTCGKAEAALKPQILVASATNVAVDNILLGLHAAGFEDFSRVGSVKKIAKAILPVTAHAPGADTNRAIADMKFMLSATGRYAVTGSDRDSVTEAIQKLESKKARS